MERIEIDEWDKKKIQKEADKEMMILHTGYCGFIGRKSGNDAVVECIDAMAYQCAQQLKHKPSNYDGAVKLAEDQGKNAKNIHGSKDIVVEGDSEQAMIAIGKCMPLQNTRDVIKMGAEVTEDDCCNGCRSFYAALAKHLGLENADFVRTDDGCKYIFSKI